MASAPSLLEVRLQGIDPRARRGSAVFASTCGVSNSEVGKVSNRRLAPCRQNPLKSMAGAVRSFSMWAILEIFLRRSTETAGRDFIEPALILIRCLRATFYS